jgi:pyruvate formate lyase activating enzyme
MSDNKGLVFHIIHGSFVDGHGVRTTVFLKGCPLACLWCCNIEGQAMYPELKFTAGNCNGCGRCLSVCAYGAIAMGDDESSPVRIDRTKCTNCLECVEVCHTEALDVFGKYYTVDELFAEIKNDAPFYRSTGGGVTIGGGEPSFQAEFTLAFLEKCRENFIHTAVDTCGYTQDREGLRVLEEADLVLFDLKGLDPDAHLRNTGVPNDVILSNLEHLDKMRKPVIVRVPLIPGLNDADESVERLAKYLSGIRCVERIDLMTYHEYGKMKYEQLGKAYNIDSEKPSEDRRQQLLEVFKSYSLNAQLGG